MLLIGRALREQGICAGSVDLGSKGKCNSFGFHLTVEINVYLYVGEESV